MLTVQVGLVHDFGLDNLFNNIFQGDNSHNLIERVPFSLIVDSLHYG